MQREVNPVVLFQSWLELAKTGGDSDPEAMTLATMGLNGFPTVRVVLYKGLLENDILFFTNYESHKGLELAANPRMALVFYWPKIYRQVRMQGVASKVDRTVSEAYFATRPRASQLGAWASHQSAIATEADIAARYATYDTQFKDQSVPCPPEWGGYRCAIQAWEFWEGRPHRLHSRTCYQLQGTEFIKESLSP